MMPAPRKRFGQHFLQDPTIIQWIIAALALNPADRFVEIGAGLGALTLPVIKQINQLTVIELDRDLVPELIKRAQPFGELTVYNEDVLKFDFNQLKKAALPLRIFGNLPYNISTPLIFHLLRYSPIIFDMLFMLQKEVAERLAASPSTSDYGRLSVMVQYHCHVERLFDVPASAFFPPPKVESSMLRLRPYRTHPYLAKDEELLANLVKHAFGQRRKTLRNSLKQIVSDEIWREVNIDPQLRAENLQVKDFVAISNILANGNA